MIIDFHTHAFPDALAERAMGRLVGDGHGIYPPCSDGTVAGLIRCMDGFGVDASVIQPIVTKPSQTKNLNRWAKSVESERICSFGGIHPETDDYKRDIDFVASLGIRGLKFHVEYQGFVLDDPKMLRIYDYAFEKGLITNTTVLANGDYLDEALALAREKNFFDKLGVHLNLTEGEPLTEDIKSCPRFVSGGVFNKVYNKRRTSPLKKAEKAAIAKELDAQISKLEAAGVKLTHADSHHHIHTGVFIAPIAACVCKAHGINKMRLHRNLGSINAVKRIEIGRASCRERVLRAV